MLSGIFAVSIAIVSLATALRPNDSPLGPRQDGWPYAPFTTSGRDILNSQGQKVVYAGVNWPGAADIMLPEGLQYQPVETIVSKIKSLGINVIRLTYAIEMIDDIYNNVDSSLGTTLPKILGTTNGSIVLQQILSKNPRFTENTTRLEVFDAVAEECAKQEIYVHTDNHMSKAKWCCSTNDNNSWFGDTDFNVTNWKRGLSYMASHAFSWPAFVSTALRNELREPDEPSPVRANYGWKDWYSNMMAAADGIHAANADPLIFFSGLGFDTDLGNVTAGLDLGDGLVFNISNSTYANKIVFELHNYKEYFNDTDCSKLNLTSHGYNAMDTSPSSTAKNIAPVVMTEFGFEQNSTRFKGQYPTCIKEFLTTSIPGGPGGWMQWVLVGSYYIREGIQDHDETWGLLNHDWSDWRSEESVNGFTKPFVEATLGVSYS